MKNQKTSNRKKIKKAILRLAYRAEISIAQARSVIYFGDNIQHVRTLLTWFKVVPAPQEGQEFDTGFVLKGKDLVLYIQNELTFTFVETYSRPIRGFMDEWVKFATSEAAKPETEHNLPPLTGEVPGQLAPKRQDVLDKAGPVIIYSVPLQPNKGNNHD